MKSGVRVGEQGNQPCPKKMKIGHAGVQTPKQDTYKIDGSDVGRKQDLGKTYSSAPPKINDEKLAYEGEDMVPAAAYEPSDSSDDFQLQVNNVLEKGEGTSRRFEGSWLARCEMSMKPTEVLEMEVDKNDPKDVDKENEQSNKGGKRETLGYLM
jgi:hypothetical protein